ncbi:g8386 [Coccomyxa elongata]
MGGTLQDTCCTLCLVVYHPRSQLRYRWLSRLQDMEGMVVRVFQGNEYAASELIPPPPPPPPPPQITAQQAKDALRELNPAWVGRLKESNSNMLSAGQYQLMPGATYHLHLLEQKGRDRKLQRKLLRTYSDKPDREKKLLCMGLGVWLHKEGQRAGHLFPVRLQRHRHKLVAYEAWALAVGCDGVNYYFQVVDQTWEHVRLHHQGPELCC